MEIDIKKAAEMLGTPEATLRRWARQGKIPVRERAGGYVFPKDELAKWAERHNIPLKIPSDSATTTPADTEVGLYDSMKRGGAFFSVPGENVREVLQAASMLIPLPDEVDREELLSRLLQREELASTGVGHGIAFPHPRYPLENIPPGGMITTCFLEKEVDFNAVDGRPVFLLFVMLSENTKTHLKLLSRLSFCLRDAGFIEFLRKCCSPDDFFLKIREMEDRIEPDGEKGGF